MRTSQLYGTTVRKVVMLFVMLMAVSALFGSSILAQDGTIGAWIEYETQDTNISSWASAAGENCLIAAATEDSLIMAFDIASGEWHQFVYPIDYDWGYAAVAGDNAAMLWSDSVLIGYSGLTSTFAVENYSGSLLLGSTYGHGCHEDMAFFVSDGYFYVFDAENTQWHSHAIPGETWEFVNVTGGEGYVLLRLRNTSDEETYIVFSYTTKTFFELAAGYAGRNILLDFGCVFWNNSVAAGSKYIGGYSALDGSYDDRYIDDFEVLSTGDAGEDFYPRTCFMFTADEVLDYTNRQTTMYGFDTRNGHFTSQSFVWQPACDTVCVYDRWNGGDFAIQVVKNALDDDTLGVYVYSGTSDDFSYVTLSLVDPGSSYSPRRHLCGGQVFTSTDFDIFMGYDAASNQFAYASMPPYVTLPAEGIDYWVSNSWGGGSVQRDGADTVHIYSYNQTGNSVQELVEYSDATVNDSKLEAANAFAYLIKNDVQPNTIWFYAPGTDSWSSRLLGDWSYAFGVTRDIIYYNDEDAMELVAFDGITGEYFTVGNGYSGYDWIDYTTGTDNYVVCFGADSNYTAYSTFTRNSCQIKDEYLPTEWSGGSILVYGKTGMATQLYYQLTYNALHDCFIPLTLTEEQGFRSYIYMGGNTALIVTSEGNLLAFDPHAGVETSIDDIYADDGALPQQFSLSQNYPNPFNPNTVISFDLPVRSKVALEVLNLLGQRVTTLVEKELPAGVHSVDWDGCNESGDRVASGLYFYRLTADGRAKSRKMMLLK